MTGKRKNRFRMKLLSLMLAASMLAGSISTSAFAAADETAEPTVTAEVTMDVTEEQPGDSVMLSGGVSDVLNPEGIDEAEEPEETETEENPGEVTEPEETTGEENLGQPEGPVGEENPDEVAAEPSEEADGEQTAAPEEPVESDVADEAEPTESGEAVNPEEPTGEVSGETDEEESVPAQVQAFLDAVAALPDASEVTQANAAEIGDQVNAIIDMWDAMDAELSAREDVETALNTAYAVFAAVLEAEGIEDAETMAAQVITGGNDVIGEKTSIRPNRKPEDYTGTAEYTYRLKDNYGRWVTTIASAKSSVNKIGEPASDNYAGSVQKQVGDTGFYQRCPYNAFKGSVCGHQISNAFAAMGYCDITTTLSEEGVIGGVGYGIGSFSQASAKEAGVPELAGHECLKMTYDALMPGTTTVEMEYYVNFMTWVVGGYCACGYSTENQQYFDWHKYKDIFTVVVNADYALNYDTQGGSAVASTKATVADTQAALKVTSAVPTRTGYKFLGWSEDSNAKTATYTGGNSITLNWSEGYGSAANPVSKTLYAVWEKDKTYTVTYTDGVLGETVFPDQSYEELKEGAKTPAFVGTIEREGYTFMGWAPTVNPVVRGDDADENGEIVYTATWQKKEDDKTYTVIYTDGVPGQIVFPDQGYEGLKEGAKTPEFIGTIEREGYTFMGWAPAVNPVVNGGDANANGEIIYTATWQKDDSPAPEQKPDLTIDKKVDKTSVKIGDTVTYTITVKNTGTATATNVKVVDPLNKEWLEWTGASYSWTAPYDGPDDGMIHSNEAGTGLYSTEPVDGKYVIKHEMRPGAEVVLTITAKAIKAGTIPANTASTEADGVEDKEDTSGEVTVDKLGLRDFTKERLTSVPAGVTIPADVTVNVDTEIKLGTGETATLLYRITVTGDKGASYKVSDIVNGKSATHVGGAAMEGQLPESGKVEIYVIMEFGQSDIKDGKLTNTATLTNNGDGNTANPDKGEAGSDVEAGKAYTVTINFKTDEGETLKDSIKDTYEEGQDYTYPVTGKADGASMFSVRALGAEVPWSITTQEGKTYVVDTVLTPADELAKLQSEGITQDVEVDIIYSLDMIGGTDSDKVHGGSDGIPDKYQAVVTYQAVNGTVNGAAEYEIVVTLKDNEGNYATAENGGKAVLTEGQIPVAAPKEGYGPEGTWSPETPVEGMEIIGDITFVITYPEIKQPEVPTYTVTYTDGVDGEEIFADQITTGLKEGDATPVFSGTPVREGYTFAGWAPEVAEKVTGNAVYVAQWTEDGGSETPTPGPETPTPTPGPETPTPTPGPETPTPTPGPETPTPTPGPETPTPTPGPETPTPTPGPETPTPTPAPETPAPTPTPGNPTPAPENPAPVAPAPENPAPVVPAPVPAPGTAVQAPAPAAAPATPVVTPVEPTVVTPEADLEEEPEEELEELAENDAPLAAPAESGEEEEGNPDAEVEIEDEATPLAEGNGSSWALVNFALMNLAVFESLMLLIGYFVNGKKEEDEKLKKKGIIRLISLPVAIVSIIAFCLTEDITLPTGFVDRWTILMAVIAVVQTAMVVLSRKKEEEA